MKNPCPTTRILTRSIATLAAALALESAAHAVNGNWTPTVGGAWGTATNWSSNPTVPGSTAGDVININTNIGAAAAITLDANRTVGTLLLGDSDTTHAFSLTGNTLILDQTAVAPALVRFGVVGSTGAIANVISSAIQLNDNARFYTTLTTPQQLTGVISGAFSMTFDNDDGITPAGPVSLQGQFLVNAAAANTYSLGTTIDDVRVTIQGNNAALGTGAVNILDGGTVFNSTGLTAIANTFNIAGNGWLETAGQLGALRLDSGAIVTGAVNMTANAGIGTNSGTGTVNGIISGTGFTLSKRGAATLVLGGANTYSGGTSVDGASGSILQLNNASAAGTGAITWASGSLGRLRVNGGVTITNAINIPAGLAGVAATGLIERSGTGLATYNGPITISGGVTNGGHIFGSNTVGDEIVLGGAITSSVTVTQREGRVIYSGSGSSFTNLTTTGAVIIGANNALPTNVALLITNTAGGSAGSLQLNNFNQTIASLNIVGGSQGTVSTGTGVLTLNGSVTSALNFTHIINGNVNLNAGTRTFTVNDGTNAIDLQTGAAFTNGTITKAGAGTMTMNGTSTANVTVNTGGLGGTGTVAALAVNTGTTLIGGTLTTNGTFTSNSLAFGTGTQTIRMDAGPGGDLLATGALTTAGTATFNLNQFGGILANGTYDLITYTGTSPGLGGFALAPMGHATAGLVDTTTAIAVQVSGNDKVIWDGTNSTAWTTAATDNWKLATPMTATDFIQGDDVIFPTAPVNSTVDIAAAVTPSNVAFTNTVATTYTVTGAAGITGTTGLTKTGNGTVVLRTQNDYTGATTVSDGTLELDHDATGNLVLTGTSGVSVAAPATLRLTRDDGNITFDRNLSGAGTVLVDPHTAAGAAVRNFLLTGTNTGFTGLWKLSPSNVGAGGLGSFRTINAAANGAVTSTNLGSAAVDVDAGGQLWFTGATTNNITITGTGYAEAAGGTPVSLAAATSSGVYLGAGTAPFTYGGTGAIRMENGTINGNVTVDGTAKIGAVNGTGTINGNISAVGGSDLLVIGGGTAAHSIIVQGAVSVPRILVNGGATAGSQTLQIGNSNALGSITSPEIILYGSAAANGVLRMNRTDGLTFTGQNILGGAAISADLARTFFLVNTTGSGVTLNNSTLDLSDGTNGGTIRVGDTAGITGSILNISGTSAVDVGYFTLAELAGVSGTVNQSGTSSVTFLQTLRVGHFGTNTSNYNISGGSITTPTAAPGTFPYTTGATEQNGGIYVGIDGTGNLTQSGGTITTNFLVLDNRGDTGAGTNMPTGVDTFQQNGGTLVLKNAQGLITRNASTAVNFNGGTIQALGASPALDSNRMTVQAGGLTLDTNGANTFTLFGPLAGTGTVALSNTAGGTGILSMVDGGAGANTTAGGTMPGGSISTPISIASNATLQSNRTVPAVLPGAVSGAGTVTKLNASSLVLTGSGSGFTGTANASAGRLDVPADFAATTINIADGASFFGESTNTNVNLGTATSGNVLFNPNTAGALTAGTITVTGSASTVDFATVPTGAGPWTAINYTTRAGAGAIGLANAAAYRVAPVVTDTGTSITVNVTGTKALTWKGTASAIWDNGATANNNWDEGSGPENFYAGDTVIFDGNTPLAITVTSGISPWKTTVSTVADNYTFNTTGAGIAGPGSLEKSGASTLTLAGPNTYSGQTIVSGGTVASATLATSLGNGSATNTIALSGGARISDTGAVALDLGATRSISVGTGGGSISHNNATAATITIPGSLTGSGTDNLSFHSNAAGAGTFVLTGDNSGYTGRISVDAPAAGTGGGLTVLRFGAQRAVPAGGSITLNYPAGGATGNATTLDLPAGTTLPSGLTLNMTSFLNGAISLRTQVTEAGAVTINSPVTLAGNSIIQFTAAAGSAVTYGGNFTETTPGSFSNVLFFRGTGTHTINGNFNLPTTGAQLSITDGATAIVNSTGNVLAGAASVFGTLRLGANDALGTTATLVIGQAGDQAATLDLNGFNQTVSTLTFAAPTGNLLTKGISNSNANTTSTFTVNQAADTTFNGTISGRINLVKGGANSLTLPAANSNFSGNVTVNSGTLVASALGAANGANGVLGVANLAGRQVTVGSVGTLSFTSNNIFGNGVGNNNLPSLTVNSGTLTSTRYNVLGPVALNGGTLTQSATDAGSYEGFQFRGTVTVGGAAASTISTGNGKANHLAANTTFTVANATGDAATDLLVSAPLRNQSGDFALATGALTKEGNGTMALTAANVFTGGVTINAGTLNVNADAALGATVGAVAINNNAVLQASGTVTTAARTVTLGAGGGTIDTNGQRVNLNAGSTVTGTTLTKTGTGVLTLAGTQTYAALDVDTGDVNLDSVLGTGTSDVNVDGRMNMSVSQTFDELIIGNGGLVTLGGPAYAPEAPAPEGGLAFDSGAIGGGGDLASVPVQGVPEPGSAMLLFGGMLTILGLRRR